jgi:hypothetical protein
MTRISTITAAITILLTVACSAGTTTAPAGVTPALAKSGLQVPGPHEVTFRRRYYREYAPFTYYAPPAVPYYAPPVYGYAAPPPAYYAPPSVYYPPLRRYYGPPVVYIDPDDDYAPRPLRPVLYGLVMRWRLRSV